MNIRVANYVGAAAIGLAIGAGGMVLAADKGSGAPDRAAIEAVVRDYILAHPEIIPEALTRLEGRTTAKAVAENRKAIETPFAGAVAGNPRGDVTLVEYFDYACGYCRASVADIDRLVAEDPKLRVVFRELPILSEASETAAKLSLAAAKQGRFLAFHHALYAGGQLSEASLAAAQAKAGLDARVTQAEAAEADVKAELDRNLEVARTVRFSGTPTFVVGDKVLNGAVGYDALKAAVAEARQGGAAVGGS